MVIFAAEFILDILIRKKRKLLEKQKRMMEKSNGFHQQQTFVYKQLDIFGNVLKDSEHKLPVYSFGNSEWNKQILKMRKPNAMPFPYTD